MNINNIIGNSDFAIDETRRAVAAWRKIQDKPESIIIFRGQATTLTAQTMRIELIRGSGKEIEGKFGETFVRMALVFGVKGHPTVSDTDIQRGDSFNYNDTVYQVIDVVEYPGEVVATVDVYDSRG